MKKATKFRLCGWSLLFLTITMLVSGLQLETNPYGARIWVWLHIIVGLIFTTDIFWHLKLHKSPEKPHTHDKNHAWAGSLFLLTFISGIIATVHWLATYTHTTIGGIHGKLGFLMIIAIIVHVRQHIRFYRITSRRPSTMQ